MSVMERRMRAREVLMQDWPDAIAVQGLEGWSIYGGIENELEIGALLACDQPTEEDA